VDLRRLFFPFVLIFSATTSLFPQDRRPLVFEFGGAFGVPFNSALGAQFISPGQTANQNLDRPNIFAGPVIDAVLDNRALISFRKQ
jgi:hypothetical protein